ncbi:MAG: hypothetical protein HYR87_07380 [Thaumarchaeota archaeon]|nr:hypothetical protein [Nitrososphaerota archaeon]
MEKKEKKEKKLSKKLEEFEQTKPSDLTLFEMLEPEHKTYSNTIEMYDFIPKYVWGKVKRILVKEVNREVLPILERGFEYRGNKYKVRITPVAITDKDGVEKDCYPGEKEEIVEDVLRKLVCEGEGVFLDGQAGVLFSLYKIRKELERIGHEYSNDQIKEALAIGSGTIVEVTTEDGTSVFRSHIFDAVGLQTFEDWKNAGTRTTCYVQFNPLVTNCIKNKSFRQINYETIMGYKNVIARQLHKRMSHHYTQASLTNPYHILLTTMIRDFGLTVYEELRWNLNYVKEGLEEMKKNEVVLDYKTEKTLDAKRRNKIIDVKFIITPHPNFSNETRQINYKRKQIQIKTN